MNDRTDVDANLAASLLAVARAGQDADRKDIEQALHLIEDAVPSLRDRFAAIATAAGQVDPGLAADIAHCVRLLQFDDLVQQVLRGVLGRNGMLCGVLDEVASDIVANGEAAAGRCVDRLGECERSIGAVSHVQQDSMRSGDVELF